MAKIWEPQPKEVLLNWIETILTEASDNLSPWETDFILSIQEQLNYKNHLSEEQEGKLEEIYVEKT